MIALLFALGHFLAVLAYLTGHDPWPAHAVLALAYLLLLASRPDGPED